MSHNEAPAILANLFLFAVCRYPAKNLLIRAKKLLKFGLARSHKAGVLTKCDQLTSGHGLLCMVNNVVKFDRKCAGMSDVPNLTLELSSKYFLT